MSHCQAALRLTLLPGEFCHISLNPFLLSGCCCDVARNDREQQVGPSQSSAGGANTSDAGSFPVAGETEQTARLFVRHVQSFNVEQW